VQKSAYRLNSWGTQPFIQTRIYLYNKQRLPRFSPSQDGILHFGFFLNPSLRIPPGPPPKKRLSSGPAGRQAHCFAAGFFSNQSAAD
jgi:hypothetical protein